jgi:hypothetical protein
MSSGVVGSNNLPGNNPERAVKPVAPLLWGQGQIVGYGQRSGRVTNKGNGPHTSCMIIFHLSP